MQYSVNNAEIQARREGMNLTMEEAAIRAGWKTKMDWNKVEKGKYPSAIALYRVSRVLGCPMEALITTKQKRAK